MTGTRARALLLLGAAGLLVGLLLARSAYGVLPPLPVTAPLTLLLLAVFELALARVVRARVGGEPSPRGPMHPLQVARAAALAKASSPTGAALAGGYLGLLVHVLPLTAVAPRRDALVAALSVAAALLLVAGALLLERACRTPPRDDEAAGAA